MIKSLFLLAAHSTAEVYFKEQFESGWEDRWVKSSWKDAAEIGEWKLATGDFYGDADDKGLQTSEDARFYGLSAKMGSKINNEGKDLVIQYTVKHNQEIDCGGAYIKLMPSGLDQAKFGGDSEYAVMFGPDICGTGTRRTHAIVTYDGKTGKPENYLHKSDIRTETDQFTHLYTFIMRGDDTYEVQIDHEKVQDGKMSENWDLLHPKKINDPEQSKPTDWVDEKQIDDPEDKKPEGYDDIPKQVPDPDATKPDDWDDEDDGEWEAPMIDNKDYKGPWSAKQIDNPDYKGEWEHPQIDNPEFKDDDKLHARCKDCEYVGFELWQVKAGTIFDDIIVTDSLEEAEAFAKTTFDVKKTAEKAMKEKQDAEKAAKEAEEEAKKKEEEKKDEKDDEESDDEEDEKKEL